MKKQPKDYAVNDIEHTPIDIPVWIAIIVFLAILMCYGVYI